MAYCTNCGQQLQHGVKFCPNCGTPAGGPSVPESFDAPPAQAHRSKASVPGILLIIFGAILAIVGAILWISGTNTNNNMDHQMESIFGNGRANPGSTSVTVGIILFVVGLVALVIGVVLQILCSLRLTKSTNSLPNTAPMQTSPSPKSRSTCILLTVFGEILQVVSGFLCCGGMFLSLFPFLIGISLTILAVVRLCSIYRTVTANLSSDASFAQAPRLKPLRPGILLFIFGEILILVSILVSIVALIFPIAILGTFIGFFLRIFGELFLYKHIPSDAANQ